MAMFEQTGTRVGYLTRAIVEWFQGLEVFDGERPINPKRLTYLRNRLAEHQFHSPVWVVASCEETGKDYTMNGRHSSLVLGTCDDSQFPQRLDVFIREFRCDTVSDLGVLWRQFDNMESMRTRFDTINAIAKVTPGLENLSKQSVKLSADAIAYVLSGFYKTNRPGNEERLRLVVEWAEYIQWASKFFSKNINSRVGIAAAIFSTWMVSEPDADKFWKLVCTKRHADPEHPSRVLADFYQKLREQSISRFVRVPKWDQRAMYCKSIHAWNAYRNGAPTSLSYYSNADIPKAI